MLKSVPLCIVEPHQEGTRQILIKNFKTIFYTWIGLSEALDDRFVQMPLKNYQVVSPDFFYVYFYTNSMKKSDPKLLPGTRLLFLKQFEFKFCHTWFGLSKLWTINSYRRQLINHQVVSSFFMFISSKIILKTPFRNCRPDPVPTELKLSHLVRSK